MLNNRQIIKIGLRSGALAGISFIALFGVCFTLFLVIVSEDIFSAYFLIPFFALGLPIGLTIGMIYGGLASLLVTKYLTTQQIPKLGQIVGSITGMAYPLILLFLGDDPFTHITLAMLGGAVLGGVSGRLGSYLFLRNIEIHEQMTK